LFENKGVATTLSIIGRNLSHIKGLLDLKEIDPDRKLSRPDPAPF
jgi:hypothetical protein